jgi:hypothetical protein
MGTSEIGAQRVVVPLGEETTKQGAIIKSSFEISRNIVVLESIPLSATGLDSGQTSKEPSILTLKIRTWTMETEGSDAILGFLHSDQDNG